MSREGSAYWGKRKKLSRPKKIESPQRLWELACDYFATVDENPFAVEEQRRGSIHIPKEAEIPEDVLKNLKRPVVELKQKKPYTWVGFEAYLFEKGVVTSLQKYQSNKNGSYDDYVDVVKAIDNIMYDQKFAGAAAGIFHAGIISSVLGLANKHVVETKDTTEIDYSKLSDDALNEILKLKPSKNDE